MDSQGPLGLNFPSVCRKKVVFALEGPDKIKDRKQNQEASAEMICSKLPSWSQAETERPELPSWAIVHHCLERVIRRWAKKSGTTKVNYWLQISPQLCGIY